MRSLAVKLTLAFLLLGITGAVLVSVIFSIRTRDAFNQFLSNRDQQSLISSLENYYQTNGSWNGVINYLQTVNPSSAPDSQNGRGAPARNALGLTLVGADRKIIYGGPPGQTSQPATTYDMQHAVALKVNSQTVGYAVFEPGPHQLAPDSPEANFLLNVNQATLLSALMVVVLALLLGGLLAFTMTRSLREITEATGEIAGGKLGMQVKVRSRDELGELASSFNKMSLDLEQATQARRQMTSDIAHDLRSPLSVISGYAEALSDSKLPGSPEVYKILYQETQHLNRLVDDLRTLSLADAGELPLILQEVNPQVLIDRVMARYNIIAAEKKVTLSADGAPDLPAIRVDLERMQQVLDNLLTNAFRYIPEGGKITVKDWAADHKVYFQVVDTGSGITPEDLPHIFDRFYRGDKARQQSGESGLGLAIARSIVEAHGGSISVASQPDKETTFTITLDSVS